MLASRAFFRHLQCASFQMVPAGRRMLCSASPSKQPAVTTNYMPFFVTEAEQYHFRQRKIDVLSGGFYSLVQDYPGRLGYWRVGVPPSGPMDHFAFRVANSIVRNSPDAAALELTYYGPVLHFNTSVVFCMTGAHMQADLDGEPVPMWKAVRARAGSTLTITGLEGCGARTYLAISGGIKAPLYLGSKATFPLGKLGGPTEGRPLAAHDVLEIGSANDSAHMPLRELPGELRPQYGNSHDIGVLLGPQEAPDYLTDADIAMFFDSTWEVSDRQSRLGVRLNGPRPQFSRSDGGEGGSHPSNVHDNAYAIGSVNFTGDHPVVLTVDGPSLGGFVCPVTIPTAEIWKVGQLKPGDKVSFRKMSYAEALQAEKAMDRIINTLEAKQPRVQYEASVKSQSEFGTRALLASKDATADSPRIEYRMAGDKHILVEYGEQVLDLNYRARVHALEQWLIEHNIKGVIDTIPGVRTLLIRFDGITLPELLKLLVQAETELPPVNDMKLRSRIFRLPLSFNDASTRSAVDQYRAVVRQKAPYLPCNIEFIAKNNGLAGVEDVRKLIFETSYMVLGLGDVYLGAPCAVPLDPRHRLVVPKYNPARTYTPEGTVGIGGCYMCIYPMESPGGYQLVGRSLPIWNTDGKLPNFTPDKPWLLDMFDQVRFFSVSEKEITQQRQAFSKGQLAITVEEEVFDLRAYNSMVASIQGEVNAMKARQRQAASEMNRLEAQMQAEAQQVQAKKQ